MSTDSPRDTASSASTSRQTGRSTSVWITCAYRAAYLDRWRWRSICRASPLTWRAQWLSRRPPGQDAPGQPCECRFGKRRLDRALRGNVSIEQDAVGFQLVDRLLRGGLLAKMAMALASNVVS